MIVQCIDLVFGFLFINIWIVPTEWKCQSIPVPGLGEIETIAFIHPPVYI